MGRTGVPEALVQRGTVPTSCRWLVALSQLSQRQTGPWAPEDLLLAPACSILPGGTSGQETVLQRGWIPTPATQTGC